MTVRSAGLVSWASPSIVKRHIVGFPHAGGAAASFRGLAVHVPSDVAVSGVELPGRGSRFREPLATSFAALLQLMLTDLAGVMDESTVLVGHSLGALFAFEVARAAQERGCRPARLVVSGHGAPHRFSRRFGIISTLPSAELRAHLVAVGTTPAEVLANDELMELVLPIVRADFALHESYVFRSGTPLTCPISVISGSRDPLVSETETMAWSELGSSTVEHHVLEAGHDLATEHAARIAAIALAHRGVS